ncbi:MAG: V-type ATPase subunit [Clostridia bacterium]|nr:V-type ATPase subunit [Clostridia bacterium]
MRETEYAYAVARIRVNELSLLTKADLDQLISADSYSAAVRILTGKGWQEVAGGDMCEEKLNEAWELICESVPDKKLLEAMVIGNDFMNVKSVIKTTFSDLKSEDYIVRPFVCDPAKIIKAVKENDFEELPDYIKECASKAYHAISGNQSGQSAEMIIDKASLETSLDYAKSAGSELLVKIIGLACLVANIKIAVRSSRTGKTEQFALDSMCKCDFTDNKKLTDAAFKGESLADIVSEAGYPEIADEVDKDFTALEMKCDNLVTEWIKKAKDEVYGPDPIIAYYYAKQAEIKNVRIILSAKAAGVPTDTIRERVRDLYV